MTEPGKHGKGHLAPADCTVPGYPLTAIAALLLFVATCVFCPYRPSALADWLVVAALITVLVMCLFAAWRMATGREDIKGFIIVVPLFLFCLSAWPPSRPRPESRSSECRWNMRNVALGLQLYASAHNEVLPPGGRWCDLLLEGGYVEDAELWCPGGPGGLCDYALNSALAGRGCREPDDTVLLFETQKRVNGCGGRELLLPEPRHPDGYNFAFADGSVRAVPAEEVDGLRWEPTSRPTAGNTQ